ncbi:MAG: citramalate synthase [Deltaproteobacteria bacterium]|nr:citramalate synthase [Deltaproteobacteria bacterium]MBW2082314.1 citramalate synthase [Deltaproteobacteria bacterium]HDM09779.1 citramalate synthase [Desulfobacteraceae bacterium]
MSKKIYLYDTTLRDGTQGEQVSLSAEDKLRIATRLDSYGFHYIEGGWPGSNPKDARFFEMAKRTSFRNSKITAFGSTRRPETSPEKDANVNALIRTETEVVTIFGKSWDLHASRILGISLEENCRMINDTVAYLKNEGREVIYDAEHFFDGYKLNSSYAMDTIQAAVDGGADMVVLCDTNGGTMPWEIEKIMSELMPQIPVPVGIHTHDDCGLAVANSLAAVGAGAVMVQGTINGYGERCGNADLISLIGNLQLKMGYECLDEEKVRHLTELSRFVSEVANIPPVNDRPFVGKSAFAHKGGVHVSAIMKEPAAYEHIDPGLVGNRRRVLVSDLSGKSNIEYKTRELGIKLGGNGYTSRKIVEEIKRLEDQGYRFEAAEGSLELLVKKVTGQFEEPFKLESLRVSIEKNQSGPSTCQATIKISVGDDYEITAAEGDGPVNALDNALRKALTKFYPEIQEMGLVDFKVRVIDGSHGTAAKVRVQIESRDSKEIWATVGVSENIIEASWQALVDSVQYKLSKSLNGKSEGKKGINMGKVKENEANAAGQRETRDPRPMLNG